MSAVDQVEVERIRSQLQKMLARVPEKVNAGSYDMAVCYKKLAIKAGKLVAAKSPKYVDLQSTHNELLRFN